MQVDIKDIPTSPALEVVINVPEQEVVDDGEQQQWIFVAPNGQQRYTIKSNLNITKRVITYLGDQRGSLCGNGLKWKNPDKVLIFGDAQNNIRDPVMSEIFAQQNMSIPASSWIVPEDVLKEDSPKILSVPFGCTIGDIGSLLDKIRPDAVICSGDIPLPMGENLQSVLFEKYGMKIPCFPKSSTSYGINDNIIQSVSSFLTNAYKRPSAENKEAVVIHNIFYASNCPSGSRLGDDKVEFQASCGKETTVKVFPLKDASHIKVNGVEYEIPERELSEDHVTFINMLALLNKTKSFDEQNVDDMWNAIDSFGRRRKRPSPFASVNPIPAPMLRAQSGYVNGNSEYV